MMNQQQQLEKARILESPPSRPAPILVIVYSLLQIAV